MRVSVCLGAILIPEYLDFHSGIYSGIYSYSGISQTNAPLVILVVFVLKWFSIECRKTKTKVITVANHKGRKQYSELIKTWSTLQVANVKRGKMRAKRHDWFRLYFWLDEKVARIFKPIA